MNLKINTQKVIQLIYVYKQCLEFIIQELFYVTMSLVVKNILMHNNIENLLRRSILRTQKFEAGKDKYAPSVGNLLKFNFQNITSS